ncbi:MAG TPA: hypothetical protein VGQ59_19385 [Cyclobacteriaceae bacterium]|jgi:short-subunit dehydrogenase involved in D-alanine esterification of teichoic acids|nr:hypothetical protein [Cyclobacteriaceae bacterium]
MIKRYLLPLVLASAIIVLYQIIDIRLFNLDVNERVREALFRVFTHPRVNESIILLNIGKLDQQGLESKIDSLLQCYPRKIGINLCHYQSSTENFVKHFQDRKSVIIANCDKGESLSLSRNNQ